MRRYLRNNGGGAGVCSGRHRTTEDGKFESTVEESMKAVLSMLYDVE